MISLLLIVPMACVHAQTAPPANPPVSALESLTAYAPPSVFDAVFPFPGASQRTSDGSNGNLDLSGEQLFQELHRSVIPAHTAPSGYKQAKAYMYSKADNITCDGGPGILTFYSDVCVRGSSDNGNDYSENGDQNRDGTVDTFINAEHIWPQGYFNSAMPMVSDIHQLASTLYTPNSRRGNSKFAVVSRADYKTSCGSKLGPEGFEPCDPDKGNVARAMLYFITRYYDQDIRQGMNYADFWTNRVRMFLDWNRQDPPDAAEVRRNDLVESFQGNRNPYIDNPKLADQVGASVFASH